MPTKYDATTIAQPSPTAALRTYELTIEETCTATFPIEAASPKEALTAARDQYRAGRLVLEPGELTSTRLLARCAEVDEETPWQNL